ncbi:LytTr DNA-binding domain-containing protein [Arcticibacter tournemirensis]|uniref:LytTR family transcriptional regulator n=1 Tax=Arcticibacter tournemirensis TaxID=699437 RepID=A0A5M9H6M8_9SPHI|nr:LytTR family DNA-binding domain-containing protein [Arcticibacter tournemirensis]KAA8482593.1 LytTR family transcriptional regulator [Arcticibacter tournemirensis]TQM52565.1 LytTr DNA-binding domain-containing protein [Arcticibacter tournemirensis]
MISLYIYGDSSLINSVNDLTFVSYRCVGSSINFRTAFLEILSNKPEVVIVDEEIAFRNPTEVTLLQRLSLVVYSSKKVTTASEIQNDFFLHTPLPKHRYMSTFPYQDLESNSILYHYGLIDDTAVFIRTNAKGVGGKIETRIDISNILYIESSRNYLTFYTDNDMSFCTMMSLRFIETKLPVQFKRINKSVIINADKITSVEGCEFVILKDPKLRIPIGLHYRREFLKWKREIRLTR